jgi:hypothetical protein
VTQSCTGTRNLGTLCVIHGIAIPIVVRSNFACNEARVSFGFFRIREVLARSFVQFTATKTMSAPAACSRMPALIGGPGLVDQVFERIRAAVV